MLALWRRIWRFPSFPMSWRVQQYRTAAGRRRFQARARFGSQQFRLKPGNRRERDAQQWRERGFVAQWSIVACYGVDGGADRVRRWCDRGFLLSGLHVVCDRGPAAPGRRRASDGAGRGAGTSGECGAGSGVALGGIARVQAGTSEREGAQATVAEAVAALPARQCPCSGISGYRPSWDRVYRRLGMCCQITKTGKEFRFRSGRLPAGPVAVGTRVLERRHNSEKGT